MMHLNIAGSWLLHEFSISFSDGRETIYPFGKDAQGQIIYSDFLGNDDQGRPYGKMSAVLSRSNRQPLSSDRLENTQSANDEEKAAAFDSYLHYAGRYHFEDNNIIHTVEFALTPNIIGNRQQRQLEYCEASGRLTLSYSITAKSGVTRLYRLIWQPESV